MNRKLISKIIGGERRGRLAAAEILEADDGDTALELLRAELQGGRLVDIVLMDFVMVAV
jgi:CheY-like chemotaxis protein